jgi:hypothetical protein
MNLRKDLRMLGRGMAKRSADVRLRDVRDGRPGPRDTSRTSRSTRRGVEKAACMSVRTKMRITVLCRMVTLN